MGYYWRNAVVCLALGFLFISHTANIESKELMNVHKNGSKQVVIPSQICLGSVKGTSVHSVSNEFRRAVI